MNLDGTTYALKETDELKGTADAIVTPSVKSYIGFTSPAAQELKIEPDGSAILEYRYARNKYRFTLGTASGVDTTGSTQTGDVYYGAAITLKASVAEGYTWTGWSNGDAAKDTYLTMPAAALSISPTRSLVTYSITYTMNGGTNASGNPSSYNVESDTVTLSDPVKTNYTFSGWTGSNGSTAQKGAQVPKGSIGNKSFTANWTPSGAIVTISFDTHDISRVTVNGTSAASGSVKVLKAGDVIKAYGAFGRDTWVYKDDAHWNQDAPGGSGSYVSCTVPQGSLGEGGIHFPSDGNTIHYDILRSGICTSWDFRVQNYVSLYWYGGINVKKNGAAQSSPGIVLSPGDTIVASYNGRTKHLTVPSFTEGQYGYLGFVINSNRMETETGGICQSWDIW